MLRWSSLSESFRLNATELNALIYEMIKEFNPQTFCIDGVEEHKLHFVRRHGRIFIIFPMCKDAESADNEPNLPFFNDFLSKFENDLKEKKLSGFDCVRLYPIHKCRGRFGLPVGLPFVKSMHAVLWVQDTQVHASPVEYNSQSSLTNFGYPNKRKELRLPNAGEQDQAFGKQAYFDPSCGYYTAQYLYTVLKDGNTDNLKNIQLSITRDFKNKAEFLKQHNVVINHDVYTPPKSYPSSVEAFLREEEKRESSMEDWVAIGEDNDVVSPHVACSLFPSRNAKTSLSCPDVAALTDEKEGRTLSFSA